MLTSQCLEVTNLCVRVVKLQLLIENVMITVLVTSERQKTWFVCLIKICLGLVVS